MRARAVNEIKRSGSVASMGIGSAVHSEFWTVMSSNLDRFEDIARPLSEFDPLRVSNAEFLKAMKWSKIKDHLDELWYVTDNDLMTIAREQLGPNHRNMSLWLELELDRFKSSDTMSAIEYPGTSGVGKSKTEWGVTWNDKNGFGYIEEVFDPREDDEATMRSIRIIEIFRRPNRMNEIKREGGAIKNLGVGAITQHRMWTNIKDKYPYLDEVMIPLEDVRSSDNMEWDIFMEKMYERCGFSPREVMAFSTKKYHQHLINAEEDGRFVSDKTASDTVHELRQTLNIKDVPFVIREFPVDVDGDKDNTIDVRWDSHNNHGYLQEYTHGSMRQVLILIKVI